MRQAGVSMLISGAAAAHANVPEKRPRIGSMSLLLNAHGALIVAP